MPNIKNNHKIIQDTVLEFYNQLKQEREADRKEHKADIADLRDEIIRVSHDFNKKIDQLIERRTPWTQIVGVLVSFAIIGGALVMLSINGAVSPVKTSFEAHLNDTGKHQYMKATVDEDLKKLDKKLQVEMADQEELVRTENEHLDRLLQSEIDEVTRRLGILEQFRNDYIKEVSGRDATQDTRIEALERNIYKDNQGKAK